MKMGGGLKTVGWGYMEGGHAVCALRGVWGYVFPEKFVFSSPGHWAYFHCSDIMFITQRCHYILLSSTLFVIVMIICL